MKTLTKNLSQYSLVIVTGGSSGIGRVFISYVLKLTNSAAICNISRSEPTEFLSNPRLTHYSCDLSDAGERGILIEKLRSRVKEAAKGKILLINNSGFGSYGRFEDLGIEKELNMIDLNIGAVVQLTHALLPALSERGGAVINVASTAAWQPTPYLSTYGATKAFLLHWGLSLGEELREKGVQVLTLCPGPTESNFFKRAGFDESPLKANLGETAEAVVETALNGLAKGKSFTVSGWANRFLVGIGSKLPRALQARLSAAVLRRMRLERHQKGS